jgi:hypothetical protein
MGHRLVLSALLLSALCTPALLHAQIRLGGLVIDDATGLPVSGARVEIFDFMGHRLGARTTSEDGTFEYPLRRPGGYRLRVARIGYAAVNTPELSTGAHSYVNVEVRLKSDAVLLTPLTVVARSGLRPSPVLDDFFHRLRSGTGTYYTRDEIQRLSPMYISDLIAREAGMRVASSGSGHIRHIYSGRGDGIHGACRTQIFVDGLLLNPSGPGPETAGLTLDEVVSPSVVEGIEIYRGLATVPAQFLTPNAQCGVVAVWTRRGDRH